MKRFNSAKAPGRVNYNDRYYLRQTGIQCLVEIRPGCDTIDFFSVLPEDFNKPFKHLTAHCIALRPWFGETILFPFFDEPPGLFRRFRARRRRTSGGLSRGLRVRK